MTGRLVTAKEAAAELGVSSATIDSWRHRRKVTPVGQLRGRGRGGRVLLYRLDELEQLAQPKATRDEPE